MKMLLEACAGLKLLKVERRDNQALYGNADISNQFLAESSPWSQHYFMNWNSDFYSFLQYLPTAVREGKQQMEKLFEDTGKDFYQELYRSEENMKKFMNGMNCIWRVYGRDVMAAFDLSSFHHICDIGGCDGALAKECVSLYPNSTVTILDLPKVVKTAKKHFVSSEESRITFHEGDFLTEPVPEADLYILARILHNRDDDECIKLLTKLYKTCRPGGGIIVVERILNEDRSGPLTVLLRAMVMLLLFGGKERTSSEYNELLHAAGFKDIQLKKRTLYSVIFGRK
uniref:Acetylserotonin O-methyltransferase n=1 Tax=Salvator merianae TaxID=96440 RepID=A0A8D0EA70_SALMN